MLIKKYSSKEVEIKEDLFLDCTNAIFGRLLSMVAKLAQSNDIKNIYLLNINNILFKSKPQYLITKYKDKINKGLGKGPYFPKNNEKFIRYILKSMFSKTKKSIENYKKIRTWNIIKQPENIIIFEKPAKIRYITKYNKLIEKIKST